MKYQVIVDHRVAAKVATLEAAVREAAERFEQPTRRSVEIVDLSGRIYREDEVKALAEEMRRRDRADGIEPETR
jgi:hypothetical protein